MQGLELASHSVSYHINNTEHKMVVNVTILGSVETSPGHRRVVCIWTAINGGNTAIVEPSPHHSYLLYSPLTLVFLKRPLSENKRMFAKKTELPKLRKWFRSFERCVFLNCNSGSADGREHFCRKKMCRQVN